jgi:hypothetical protein
MEGLDMDDLEMDDLLEDDFWFLLIFFEAIWCVVHDFIILVYQSINLIPLVFNVWMLERLF